MSNAELMDPGELAQAEYARWANEGYLETMGAIRKDKFIGPFVARHERGASNARISHLEEGKKRIQ